MDIPRQATPSTGRRLLAEYLGALLLAAVVIGSGIAAQRLSPTDTGLQLLENAAATAVGLYVIIVVVGPVSGAHLNPVVTVAEILLRRLPLPIAAAYGAAQIAGCVSGAVLANLMFARTAIDLSHTNRATAAHLLAEVVATAGLILVIFGLVHTGRIEKVPAAVAAYIGAAYWFTSSTSFANPAITIGRIFSDTFAGIAPGSTPPYIAAQLLGGGLGLLAVRLLYPHPDPATRTRTVARPSGGQFDPRPLTIEVHHHGPAHRRVRGVPPRTRTRPAQGDGHPQQHLAPSSTSLPYSPTRSPPTGWPTRSTPAGSATATTPHASMPRCTDCPTRSAPQPSASPSATPTNRPTCSPPTSTPTPSTGSRSFPFPPPPHHPGPSSPPAPPTASPQPPKTLATPATTR